jgi:anaerobic ribonucleoside-triphosphate reductase activating protein
MKDKMKDLLLVHLLHFPVRTLGPGVRVGVWCQGCAIGCPGCITPESREFLPERAVPVDELAERVLAFFEKSPSGKSKEFPVGLTVSGGEPFDQPKPLLDLLRILNGRGVSDVLIYSGYPAEDLLARHPDLPRLAAALVDGPFEAGNPTDAAWKGSDNQRLHLWRPEFEARYREWTRSNERRLQFAADGQNRKVLIGIPRQADVERLRELKN